MKENERKVTARFAPDTRFEVNPVPVAPFRSVQESRFERLKGRLLDYELGAVWERDGLYASSVRRAANEAAALAWATPYPLLVFPVLFEEQVQGALVRAERQEQVWARSRELLIV